MDDGYGVFDDGGCVVCQDVPLPDIGFTSPPGPLPGSGWWETDVGQQIIAGDYTLDFVS